MFMIWTVSWAILTSIAWASRLLFGVIVSFSFLNWRSSLMAMRSPPPPLSVRSFLSILYPLIFVALLSCCSHVSCRQMTCGLFMRVNSFSSSNLPGPWTDLQFHCIIFVSFRQRAATISSFSCLCVFDRLPSSLPGVYWSMVLVQVELCRLVQGSLFFLL